MHGMYEGPSKKVRQISPEILGFDHEHFTYRHAGRDFRLTDVHGKVVKDLIA